MNQKPPFPKMPGSSSRLSHRDRARNSLLAARLNLPESEAGQLVRDFTVDVSSILGIPQSAIDVSTEFSGRELDLLFTINRQNTPKK